jgi:hypothetical protein
VYAWVAHFSGPWEPWLAGFLSLPNLSLERWLLLRSTVSLESHRPLTIHPLLATYPSLQEATQVRLDTGRWRPTTVTALPMEKNPQAQPLLIQCL